MPVVFSVSKLSQMPCQLNWKFEADFPAHSYSENAEWMVPKSIHAEIGTFKHLVREAIPQSDIDLRRAKFDELAEESTYASENRNSKFIGDRFIDFVRPTYWSKRPSWVTSNFQTESSDGERTSRNGLDRVGSKNSKGTVSIKPEAGTESYFCLPSLRINGFIDELIIDSQKITVCEYKSHHYTEKNNQRSELQCDLYALAVSEFYPDHEVFCKLVRLGAKNDEKPVVWHFDHAKKKSTLKKLEQLIDGYESDSVPSIGEHCSFCRFRARCSAWNAEIISNQPYKNPSTGSFDIVGTVTELVGVEDDAISKVTLQSKNGDRFKIHDVYVGYDPPLLIKVGVDLTCFNLIRINDGQAYRQRHKQLYKSAIDSLIVVDNAC